MARVLNYWWWVKRRRAKQGGGGEPGGGPDGSGIQLESADFLLAENGNYLILE